MTEKKISRRDLLTFWRRSERPPSHAVTQSPAAPGPFESVRAWPIDRTPGPTLGRKLPLRPPGAMQERLLREACTRCNLCVEVCPAQAIVPLDASWGSAQGTPAIDPRKNPCVVCTGYKCTDVCPSGALQPVVNLLEIRMGTAVVDTGCCVTYGGVACAACVTSCPSPGALRSDEHGHPLVDENRCVGCGLCVRACVTEPTSIQVVPRG